MGKSNRRNAIIKEIAAITECGLNEIVESNFIDTYNTLNSKKRLDRSISKGARIAYLMSWHTGRDSNVDAVEISRRIDNQLDGGI